MKKKQFWKNLGRTLLIMQECGGRVGEGGGGRGEVGGEGGREGGVRGHETIYCPLARDHAQITIQPGKRQ